MLSSKNDAAIEDLCGIDDEENLEKMNHRQRMSRGSQRSRTNRY